MQVTAHSRLAVGVGLAAAGVIAVGPLSAPTNLTHLPAIPAASDVAVALSAAYNPLQPWVDAFETAAADAKTLYKDYSATPAVLLQQILANQVTHIKEVLKNPGSIGTVLGQVVKNVGAVVQAATLLGVDASDHPEAAQQSLDGWHDIMLQSIPKLMWSNTPTAVVGVVKEVLNVLSSPISGIAMGLLGPVASPVVALVNSATAIAHSLLAGNLAGAVQSLINIPAKMVGAVLNGATANLNGLVPVLNKLGLLKDTTMHTLSLAFGGLFSTGVTGQAQTGIGGSIFNALGMNVTTGMMGFPLTIDIQGRALGPIAALVSFGQIMAKALGWSGTGNPLKTATTKTTTTTTAAAAADAASATSIPSVTTTGVTVNAAAKVASADTASAKIATTKIETTKIETVKTSVADDPTKLDGDPAKSDSAASDATSGASDSSDTASTDSDTKGAATERSGKSTKSDSGKSDSADSDSASSGSTKSDSVKSGSTKHGSKHNSVKSGSVAGGSAKSGSMKSGSRHHGKSHASRSSHSG
jgi:hypothetical protein